MRLVIVNYEMSILGEMVLEWLNLTTMSAFAAICQECDEADESC